MDQGNTARSDRQPVWPNDEDVFRNALERIVGAGKVRARWQRLSSYFLAVSDVLALFASLFIGKIIYWLYFQSQPPAQFSMDFGPVWSLQSWLFHALVLGTLTWFWSAGHYSKRRPIWDELRETIKILLFVGMLDAALIFLAKWPVSRLWVGMTWALALVLVPAFRMMAKTALLSLGGWLRPTVVVGIGPNAARAAEALTSEKLMGYGLLAFIAGPGHLANNTTKISIGSREYPVLYYRSRLWELLDNLGSPHLVVALEHGEEQERHALMQELGENYRNLHIAPPVTGLPLYGTEVDRFFRHEVLLLSVRNNLSRLWAKAAKRAFDFVSAAVLLFILAPLFLFVALRIKIEDGGPVFFTQERVGRKGRPFKVLKFRSMVLNAHETLLQWLQESPEIRSEYEGNNFKLRNDPRVTRAGQWLRRTSIDELPQLWNVIKGEMSLVGPRPLLARELDDYGDTIKLYKQARPGITGIWQISGRSKTSFKDRANLDAWYIRNWSLWYDLYILLRTAVVVFKRDGAY